MSLARKVVTWAIVASLLGLGLAALLNRQLIADHVAVSRYEPTKDVADMVVSTGMSDKGRFHFYAAHPEVASAEVFNSACERHPNTSPILGCYLYPANKIYIYDVTDAELNGIKEVTAAHEMLHVAYVRLDQSKQEWLAKQLEAAYERLKTDNLVQRIKYYESSEPGSRINELHSILPTEFRDLGEELEEYYAEYFDDRQAVIDLYEAYSGRFYALESESRLLADRLEGELVDIELTKRRYESDVAALNQAVASFNARAESGYFQSQEAFDSARSMLMARSAELAARYNQLNLRIDEYNRGVERLNALGVRIQKLNKSIDSFEEIQ